MKYHRNIIILCYFAFNDLSRYTTHNIPSLQSSSVRGEEFQNPTVGRLQNRLTLPPPHKAIEVHDHLKEKTNLPINVFLVNTSR